MKNLILILVLIYGLNVSQVIAQYFPPNNSENWEKIDPTSLNWNNEKIEELYKFLDEKNTKSFIVLKDGKIVLEKYFDSFTADSIWYWASAGKTLTSALVGIAQEEGLLSINEKSSKYLGEGWTSCTKEKEDLITIRHQLTMTTGLDYEVNDVDCTEPECLKYKADSGTQWFYHNAPYTLLDKVIENSTNQNFNLYFAQKIRNPIGMNGIWIKRNSNNVYYSNTRSMARYGILISNNGYWENQNIIKDKDYIQSMINTSQDLNKSFGYLWWLNGKESFMIPGTNRVFNGYAMPDATADLYAALGRDGQILNIVPSKGLIVVRMGEKPDDQFFISNAFNNQIWQYLNEITENETSISDINSIITIYPNPTNDYINLNLENIENISYANKDNSEILVNLYNSIGNCVVSINKSANSENVLRIPVSHLPIGVYYLNIGNYTEKVLIFR